MIEIQNSTTAVIQKNGLLKRLLCLSPVDWESSVSDAPFSSELQLLAGCGAGEEDTRGQYSATASACKNTLY